MGAQLRARINKLDEWIAEEAVNTAPPTLYDVIKNILGQRGIYNLQAAAKILIFLQENEIPDVVYVKLKLRKNYKSKVRKIYKRSKDVPMGVRGGAEYTCSVTISNLQCA